MNKLVIPGLALVLLAGIGIWFSFQEPSLDDFELDKGKQKQIWDAEHVTFEIESYFGKPFAKALRSGDDESIRKLVNPDFRAETFVTNETSSKQIKTFSEIAWSESDDYETGDVEQFIRFFRSRMTNFAKVNRAKVRVLHIASVPGDQFGWNTELLVTVHGLTESQQPIQISSHHDAIFRFEEDSEIRLGGAAMSWKSRDLKITQATQPFFKEVTKDLNLQQFGLPDNWTIPYGDAKEIQFQVAVEDYDRDGDYDLAVATYDGWPLLLENENGKFVDKTSKFGLSNWQPTGPKRSCLAGWADLDNDGYPELVLGTSIYKNQSGQDFRNITAQSGFDVGHDPYGMTVADYNCDGLLDIYLSRSHEYKQHVEKVGWVGDNESGTSNSLWKNLGNNKFEEVTVEANAGGGNRITFAASWFYLDDDHYPDLYLANDFSKNVVLRNKGDGSFEDVSDQSGAADFATSMGVATGDLDNDGETEIYVANMYSKMGRRIIAHVSAEDYPEEIFPQIQGSCAGNRLYQKGSNGQFEDVTDIADVNEVGWAFAPLMADFDGDGLLDLYATTGFMSFQRSKPDG